MSVMIISDGEEINGNGNINDNDNHKNDNTCVNLNINVVKIIVDNVNDIAYNDMVRIQNMNDDGNNYVI